MTAGADGRWAWIFPGQGGQFAGMSRELFRTYPAARRAAEEAEDLSGLPLRKIAQAGPSAELRRPEVLEPLLAATSVAYVDILKGAGYRPSFVAGYSAGKVGALYAAGVLRRSEALRVGVWRGEVLRDALEHMNGGMSAVLMLAAEDVAAEVAAMAAEGASVWVAAENSPRHVTVTGLEPDLGRLEARLVARGGEVHPIDVAGPWHGPWLREAERRLAAKLANLVLPCPGVPVCSGATGRVETNPRALAEGMTRQLAGTIRWRQVVDDLHGRGCRRFLEVGAGRVLRDLIRRNLPVSAVERLDGLEGRDGGGGPLRRMVAAGLPQSIRPATFDPSGRL